MVWAVMASDRLVQYARGVEKNFKVFSREIKYVMQKLKNLGEPIIELRISYNLTYFVTFGQ